MQKREPSKKDLGNLCNQQKVKIRGLKTGLRALKRDFYDQIEEFLRQYADESKMSYVVIRGLNKIVALTPSFKKRFRFSDELIGSNCYKVLNNPLDDLTQKDFEEVFNRNPEEIEETAVVRDGKGKDRYVVINKEKPIQCVGEFYTRVQIYEIGGVKRSRGYLKRILGLKGDARTFAGYVARKKAEEISANAEAKKKEIMSKN